MIRLGFLIVLAGAIVLGVFLLVHSEKGTRAWKAGQLLTIAGGAGIFTRVLDELVW